MDRFDEPALRVFLGEAGKLGVPSTCFFLRHQVREGGETVRSMQNQGYEIGLHSEARPWASVSMVPLLLYTEWRYRRNLHRQVRQFRRRGFTPQGHSVHSVHNYLGFQTWVDWNCIEQATIGAGLTYISDWRTIARSPEGTRDFPPPLPPFRRRLNDDSILVIPTSWDDKFFFSSYEEKVIARSASSDCPIRGLDEALSSISGQLDRCVRAEIPFVMNTHPIYGVEGRLPLHHLKQGVLELALRRGLPVYSLGGLSEILHTRDHQEDHSCVSP